MAGSGIATSSACLCAGATLATVGSYPPAAHVRYAALGFVDNDLSEPWDKTG